VLHFQQFILKKNFNLEVSPHEAKAYQPWPIIQFLSTIIKISLTLKKLQLEGRIGIRRSDPDPDHTLALDQDGTMAIPTVLTVSKVLTTEKMLSDW
jgi:hypothetical protein